MRRKQYGHSKTASCPFCGKAAYAKNKDGVPVCADHKRASLGEMTCVCGEWLEQKKSKWGVFFVCRNCGPVNMQKALSVNEVSAKPKNQPSRSSNGSREEEVVTPDDPRYFS